MLLEHFATVVTHVVLLGVEPGNLESIDKARLRYDWIADRTRPTITSSLTSTLVL